MSVKKIFMRTYFYKSHWLVWAILLGMASNSMAQSFEIIVASDEIEISLGEVHQILVKTVDAQNQVIPEVNFNK